MKINIMRAARFRHLPAIFSLAELCKDHNYGTSAEAMPLYHRAARLNFEPAITHLAQMYNAVRSLNFYWSARASPNSKVWHEQDTANNFAKELRDAFTLHGGKEYLPLLFAKVNGTVAPPLVGSLTVSTAEVTTDPTTPTPVPTPVIAANLPKPTRVHVFLDVGNTTSIPPSSGSSSRLSSGSGGSEATVHASKASAPEHSNRRDTAWPHTPSPAIPHLPVKPATPSTMLTLTPAAPAPAIATAAKTPSPTLPAHPASPPRTAFALTLSTSDARPDPFPPSPPAPVLAPAPLTYALPTLPVFVVAANPSPNPNPNPNNPHSNPQLPVFVLDNSGSLVRPYDAPPDISASDPRSEISIPANTTDPIAQNLRRTLPVDTPVIATKDTGSTAVPRTHSIQSVISQTGVPIDRTPIRGPDPLPRLSYHTGMPLRINAPPASDNTSLPTRPSPDPLSPSSVSASPSPSPSASASASSVTPCAPSPNPSAGSPQPSLNKPSTLTVPKQPLNISQTVFSLTAFLHQADIAGPDVALFQVNCEKERLDTEEVLLKLSSEELQVLGLTKMGDRKRYITCASKWQELRLGSRLPEGTIIKTEELTVTEPPMGQGNFAAVYRGTFNAAPVAVKVLFNIKADDEEFWTEAKTLHELSVHSHPNVLRFFGLCKLQHPVEGWAFVTEYMSNGSLKDFLVEQGESLRLGQLFGFARSAAAGMLHMSNQSPPILHRDLGARNLLVGELDEREGTYSLRVADFGLARLSDAGGEYIVHGASPARWTAPEVWKQRKHTVAADVYSFGITLWEIFTRGLRPFDDLDDRTVVKKLVTLLAKVREGMQLPIAVGDRSLPPEVHQLMLACTHMNSTDRPSWFVIHRRLQEMESAAKKHSSGRRLLSPNPISSASPLRTPAPPPATALPPLGSSDPFPAPLSPGDASPNKQLSSSADRSINVTKPPMLVPAASSPSLLTSPLPAQKSPRNFAIGTGAASSLNDVIAKPSLRATVSAEDLSLEEFPPSAPKLTTHIGPHGKPVHSVTLLRGVETIFTQTGPARAPAVEYYSYQGKNALENSQLVSVNPKNFPTPAASHRRKTLTLTALSPKVNAALLEYSPLWQNILHSSFVGGTPDYKERELEAKAHAMTLGVAACSAGHPRVLRLMPSKPNRHPLPHWQTCVGAHVTPKLWTCDPCKNYKCTDCYPSDQVQRRLAPQVATLIKQVAGEGDVSSLWLELVEGSTLFWNGQRWVSLVLLAMAKREKQGDLACFSCDKPLYLKDFVWRELLGDPRNLCTPYAVFHCDDCILCLVADEDCGLSKKGAEHTLTRMCGDLACHKWFLYASHCFISLACNSKGVLSLGRFARVLAWFGPWDGADFLKRCAWLVSRPWFYGDLSSQAAQTIAEVEGGGAVGSWLFRFSATEPGSYAFTVVSKDNRIMNYRVTRGGSQHNDFILRVNGVDEHFANLPVLLDGAVRLLKLRTPICTSRLDQMPVTDDVTVHAHTLEARTLAKGELMTTCAAYWSMPLP